MNILFAEKPVPPFRLDFTAWVLRRNADNIIDRWDGEAYRRVLTIRGKPAEVAVFQEGSSEAPVLQIYVSRDICEREVEPAVSAALQRLLGTQDGRVRGVLLWNVWNRINAARELIAAQGVFQPEIMREQIFA